MTSDAPDIQETVVRLNELRSELQYTTHIVTLESIAALEKGNVDPITAGTVTRIRPQLTDERPDHARVVNSIQSLEERGFLNREERSQGHHWVLSEKAHEYLVYSGLNAIANRIARASVFEVEKQ